MNKLILAGARRGERPATASHPHEPATDTPDDESQGFDGGIRRPPGWSRTRPALHTLTSTQLMALALQARRVERDQRNADERTIRQNI